MVKWATAKPPRHQIWESVSVLLVDACWKFFHNVLNLSPNRCHLYNWLSAFPYSYILHFSYALEHQQKCIFQWLDWCCWFFHCICNVTFFNFVLFCAFFFSPGTLLKMAKYLERASLFILFCCIKRIPLTTMLELIWLQLMTKMSIWKKGIYGNLQNTARIQDLHSIYAPWVLWLTWRSPRKPFLDSILTMDLAPLLVGRTAKTGSAAAIAVVGPVPGLCSLRLLPSCGLFDTTNSRHKMSPGSSPAVPSSYASFCLLTFPLFLCCV